MEVKVGRKIKSIIARDRKSILTTTRESYPFVVERADGDYAYDAAGNRFIDFTSFISVYNFGNNGNAEIRSAVKKQVDRLMHSAFLDFYAEPPVSFAENLLSMFPAGFGKVFFSNSGTEANEDAIKLSRIFTKRHHLIAFYNSFHGRSLGSLSLTASRMSTRRHLGPFSSVYHAPFPNPYRCPHHSDDPEECSKETIDFIQKYLFDRLVPPSEVAAIFTEPIQGEGGYIVPPRGFFKQLRELADKHNILLVDDEVQAGYMRTGKFLALSNFGVSADIYTMAKAIGGGLPLAATVSRTSLGDVPAGEHAGTFGGNLVSVAAANATLSYLKRNMRSIQSQVRRKGNKIMKRLKEMQDAYELVGDARGIGMMLAIELVKSKKTKEHAVKERERVLAQCFASGLLLLPASKSVIRIIPPLTISDSNIEKGLDVLEKAIKNNSR